MGLTDEILSRLGIEEEILFSGAKVVLYAGTCAYFENVLSIAAFSPEALVLRVRTGEVRVEGKQFVVAHYGAGDLLLRGDIQKIEFVGGEG